MEYYFVADFGSSNSGCAFMDKLYEQPHLLHRTRGTAYAKEETRFAITPAFLKRLVNDYNNIKDSDFIVKSDTKGLFETANPNIVWREDSLSSVYSPEYIFFSNFKMSLYKHEKTVKGSDGQIYPIDIIIKVFLRLLKIDSYIAFQEDTGSKIDASDSIHWGVTIPSIWGAEEKQLMREIALVVFGNDATILSEPQGALTYYINFANQGKADLKNGRISIIIDAGGGTTDLACVIESRDENGQYSLNSMNLPDGEGLAGNDIDDEFWIELCKILVNGSGTTEKYRRVSNIYDELLGNYMAESQEGRKELFQQWRKIQFNRYEKNARNLSFVFSKEYRNWLKRNNHTEIAQFILYEEREIEIPSTTVDKCHNSIIKQGIVPKIDAFISSTLKRFQRIDRIVLAGGLSYTSTFKNEILTLARQYKIDDVQTCSAGISQDYLAITKCSGAVAMGAVYQLAHPDLMVYSAVQSYYYEVYTTESRLLDVRMDEYKPFNFASILNPSKSTSEQYDCLRAKIEEYQNSHSAYKITAKDPNGEICVRSLSPICVRGCLATSFKTTLTPMSNGQTEIVLPIYVSDNPYVLYCSDNNPDIVKLDTIRISIGHSFKNVTLEIKLSDAQNANPIVVTLTDDNGNIIKSSGIQSKLRKGF